LDPSLLVEALIAEIKLDSDSVNQLLLVISIPQLGGKESAVTELPQVGLSVALLGVMMLIILIVVVTKN
jgi:hypothetical protein